MSESETSTAARHAVSEAMQLLTPHADDPAIAAVVQTLGTLAGEGSDGGQDEDALAQELIRARAILARLDKSQDSPELLERLRKAYLQLQREHLARVNAPAAQRWEDTWGSWAA